MTKRRSDIEVAADIVDAQMTWGVLPDNLLREAESNGLNVDALIQMAPDINYAVEETFNESIKQ